MTFRCRRSVTPLYLHLQHARRPSLAFIGIHLSIPCPIPFFECQSAYLAEVWSRPAGEELTTREERNVWVEARLAATAASGREQDLHYTSAEGGSAWHYMRSLIRVVQSHASYPLSPDAAAGGDEGGADRERRGAQARSWIEQSNAEARLSIIESMFADRSARYPQLPWHDDSYRRCEYSVDWALGTWAVDTSRC